MHPGRFILITQRQKEAKVRYFSDDDPVIGYIQTRTIMLRESQRTPEWFLLQKFWTTETGAYAVWMLLSRYPDVDHDENINTVLRVLNLLQGRYQEEEVVYKG